jgi:hypothetical protein
VKKLVILVILFGLALSVSQTFAQDVPPALQDAMDSLAETPFDGYALSLPNHWLTWRQEDHGTAGTALDSLLEMLVSVDAAFNTRSFSDLDPKLRFVAIAPALAEEQLIMTEVWVTPLSPVLDNGKVRPNQALTMKLLDDLGVPAFGISTSHNRDLAIGLRDPEPTPPDPLTYTIAVLYLFPEQDQIVLVLTTYSPLIYQEQASKVLDMMVSVRLNGEDVDHEVWNNMIMVDEKIDGSVG